MCACVYVCGQFCYVLSPQTPVLAPLRLSCRCQEEATALAAGGDMDAIVARDACYTAVGLGSFDLYEGINFTEWFWGSLSADLEVNHPNYKASP